ncbi:Calmodulin-3 [Nowakowskiella sp. JEL0407]|nr:Calmodulin-3 [Nowakowskiella sp. JEL0407]KAJ3123622.1 Calmodulin-3 [Nowakowskiella sp. JEL0407]
MPNNNLNTTMEEESSTYLSISPGLLESSGLNLAELQELKEIFSLVDKDHGGTISKEELGILMNTMGLRASKVELETMMNEIDVHGTGEIDFEGKKGDIAYTYELSLSFHLAFVGAMSRKVQTSLTADQLRKSFKLFDEEDPAHDGTLTMAMMVKILTDYGDRDKRLTAEEAEDLISQVAPQAQTGIFDYNQFINISRQNIQEIILTHFESAVYSCCFLLSTDSETLNESGIVEYAMYNEKFEVMH